MVGTHNAIIATRKSDISRHLEYLIKCPVCKKERWLPGSNIEHLIRVGSFTGKCRDCSTSGPNSNHWSDGRFVAGGYVRLSISGLDYEDQLLARAMVGDKRFITEHRFVAAKQLGRPLLDNEVVHHINGIKIDNEPENLHVDIRDNHGKAYAEIYRELLLLRKENKDLKERLRRYEYNGH